MAARPKQKVRGWQTFVHHVVPYKEFLATPRHRSDVLPRTCHRMILEVIREPDRHSRERVAL